MNFDSLANSAISSMNYLFLQHSFRDQIASELLESELNQFLSTLWNMVSKGESEDEITALCGLLAEELEQGSYMDGSPEEFSQKISEGIFSIAGHSKGDTLHEELVDFYDSVYLEAECVRADREVEDIC